MNTLKYLLFIILSLFFFTACEKDKDIEKNDLASKLVGTWIQSEDCPWYSHDGEKIIYVFKENGECIEITIESKGYVLKYECYYTFNPKNRVLTISSNESPDPYWYHVIKFIDDNTILMFESHFLWESGYDKNNLPVDDKHYKEDYDIYDISILLRKVEYPIDLLPQK